MRATDTPPHSGRYRTQQPRLSTVPDRRVERTRRTLHEALVGLLQERSWDAVTVQDLCARADVGRSTFYTHFADKEALLAGGFEDFRRMLRAHCQGSALLIASGSAKVIPDLGPLA